MAKYQVEIGQIRKKWRGWDGYEEFYEADEWATFDLFEYYQEEIRNLKRQGYVVYDEDDYTTQFICE